MTHWINAQWHQGLGEPLTSHSPYNDEEVWHGSAATPEQVNAAVESANAAFLSWRLLSCSEREAYVLNFEQLLKENQERIAEVIALETGKPLWESRTEVSATIAKIQVSIRSYHTRTGESFSDNQETQVVLRHRPIGVFAIFGPYNFPAHLPNGHIVPALLAGNCVVFKPSEHTPFTAELMVSLWEKSGLPQGVINLVQGERETGKSLLIHPLINGVLFTGSAQTGHEFHHYFAGQPDKMLALEMGGNNPLVVSSSYGEMTAAVYTILQSAYLSSGQRCTCARRLLLPRGQEGDHLLSQLTLAVESLKCGEPLLDPQPFMGSLISRQAVDMIIQAQAKLEKQGATVLVEAKHQGYAFVSPSLIDVTDVLQLDDEEYFGPILQVIRYNSLEEAVMIANDTRYGLSAGLISTKDQEWHYFVDHIHAGVVNRNRPLTGASGELPFGGPGASGNFRPSAFYAADYCAYPMASIEGKFTQLPTQLLPGINLSFLGDSD
ncbi:succinylglutamate-semialdehyde dehydrogenase [Vibrio sp.]|nr:succinylglutamate-semialdehyde dehydrogenase [Vibrio sp.]